METVAVENCEGKPPTVPSSASLSRKETRKANLNQSKNLYI